MGGSGSKTEKFGPTDAEYKMTIQYCGGWGYRSKAVFIQQNVEKEFGDKLQVIFEKDKGITGNLEIKVTDSKGKSTMIHSKKEGGGFVKQENVQSFIDKVNKIVKA